MNFFHRKPKAAPPVLLVKQSEMDIITQLNRTIDEREAHIKIQTASIEALHEQLEMARAVQAVQASQADTIASQKDTIASLEREVGGMRRSHESFEHATSSLVEQRAILQALSKRAVHLLLYPRGMHQSWKVDRERLLAEYKAVGIEDE